jgi:hypothetical protein
MTKIIRLTEGDLHRIIENSVRRVLKEEESRNGKGTGVDKLSDSELIAKYKLEKKFLNGDFTDDEVYDLGFTIAEKKKFDKALGPQQDKMIEKRVTKTAKTRYKKYREILISRGLIKPKSTKKQETQQPTVPNMNANVGTFAGRTDRKVKRSHTPEEVQKAQELLPPMMEDAKQLFAKYGAYDTAGRFNEIFNNINLAMYEFTGTEIDDNNSDLPQSYQDNENPPSPDEAKNEIDQFRINDVYPAFLELKTQHLKNCLVSTSRASTEISKVLSGKEATEDDIRKGQLRNLISARHAAAKAERDRLKINGVENDLL